MRWAPRRRTAVALVAVLAWLACVELGPGLHVGLHAALAPHTHDGDRAADGGHPGEPVIRISRVAGSAELDRGLHVHDGAAPHVHGPGEAGHARAQRRRAMPWDELAPPHDVGHGQHSVAHRCVLFATPAPALALPPPVWISTVVAIAERPAPAVVAPELEPSSRGPPRG